MSSSQDKSHEGSAGSKLRSKVEEEEEEEEVTVATVGERVVEICVCRRQQQRIARALSAST